MTGDLHMQWHGTFVTDLGHGGENSTEFTAALRNSEVKLGAELYHGSRSSSAVLDNCFQRVDEAVLRFPGTFLVAIDAGS